ncbi:MAG: hypothetical protein OIN66_11725, partial [Candidatus Methanoperedens sp.]|nr:hypothetical protein [Candidatus Methanoperedens sp.]
MVQKTTMRNFGAINDGATDWDSIRKNFTDLEKTVNDHYNEIKAIAQRQTFQVSGMFQTRGKHTLMHAGKHLRCKPINAFAIVHDNVAAEVQVNLVNLSSPAKF